jgi:hypothetical protein
MLFSHRIDSILHEQLHRLTATNELPLAFMQHFHDVTAYLTLVDLQLFRHMVISPLYSLR